MRRLVLLLVLPALLATGCRVDALWETTIGADGTGTVVHRLAFDDEFTRLAEGVGSGDVRRAAIRDGELAAIAGAEVAESREDDMDVFTITVPFASVSALGTILATNESPFQSHQVIVDEDEAFFRAEAGIPGVLQVASVLEAIPGASEDIITNLIAESVSYLVRIDLPGEVTDENADRIEEEGLEWDIRLDPDFLPVVVTAVSDPTPPGGFPWWVLGGLGLVLGLGLVAVMMAGRQETRAALPETADAGTAETESNPA